MPKNPQDPLAKFWPGLTYPLSFKDALGTLTKAELTSIRQHLQISSISTLDKSSLIDKLQTRIPDSIYETFPLWDRDRLTLIQNMVRNNGRWEKPLLEIQQYDYFRVRGILFPGTVNGKKRCSCRRSWSLGFKMPTCSAIMVSSIEIRSGFSLRAGSCMIMGLYRLPNCSRCSSRMPVKGSDSGICRKC
ncbi:hypothetical protein GE107_02725 [Cohnella sp. CFH 77786]|uniref:hypothetical protein n=1 Tax=Cohnella sp. CFH 77786 TaxID=2662265 RepID=UPI001C60C785|nr:hypothetical protein [Cohnella sp. CFH 77786]MBW5444979.1 hypothetical protein [Cohnella sp. CFH 77786]